MHNGTLCYSGCGADGPDQRLRKPHQQILESPQHDQNRVRTLAPMAEGTFSVSHAKNSTLT